MKKRHIFLFISVISVLLFYFSAAGFFALADQPKGEEISFTVATTDGAGVKIEAEEYTLPNEEYTFYILVTKGYAFKDYFTDDETTRAAYVLQDAVTVNGVAYDALYDTTEEFKGELTFYVTLPAGFITQGSTLTLVAADQTPYSYNVTLAEGFPTEYTPTYAATYSADSAYTFTVEAEAKYNLTNVQLTFGSTYLSPVMSEGKAVYTLPVGECVGDAVVSISQPVINYHGVTLVAAEGVTVESTYVEFIHGTPTVFGVSVPKKYNASQPVATVDDAPFAYSFSLECTSSIDSSGSGYDRFYTISVYCNEGDTVALTAASESVSYTETAQGDKRKLTFNAFLAQSQAVLTYNGTAVSNLGSLLLSGNKHFYFYSLSAAAATRNYLLTFTAMPVNSYAVSAEDGVGFTVTLPQSTAEEDTEYSFSAQVLPQYSQSTLQLYTRQGYYVNAVRSQSDNSIYNCTISGFTSDITIYGNELFADVYKVTLQEGEGSTCITSLTFDSMEQSYTATYGESFTIAVTYNADYTQNPISFTINGVAQALTEVADENATDLTHTFTVPATLVKSNLEIVVDDLPINTFNITLRNGVGSTISIASQQLETGSGLSFFVDVAAAYTNGIPVVTVSGAVQSASSNSDYNGGIRYAYSLAEGTVLQDMEISVADLSVNTYTASINYGTGVEVSYSGTALTHGVAYSFTVTKLEGYESAPLVVQVNQQKGLVQIAQNGTVYTVTVPAEKVTANLSIEVDDLLINSFEITSLAGTGTRFLLDVNAVSYGEALSFSVEKLTGYTLGELTVSANGTPLIASEVSQDGTHHYVIQNVQTVIALTTLPLSLNVYPVTVNAGEGTQINAAATVIHGSSLVITTEVLTAYSASSLQLSVNGNPVTVNENGEFLLTSEYTVGQVTLSTLPLTRNVYTVGFSVGSGYNFVRTGEEGTAISHGDELSFTLVISENYYARSFRVMANNQQLHSESLNYLIPDVDGNVYVTLVGYVIQTPAYLSERIAALPSPEDYGSASSIVATVLSEKYYFDMLTPSEQALVDSALVEKLNSLLLAESGKITYIISNQDMYVHNLPMAVPMQELGDSSVTQAKVEVLVDSAGTPSDEVTAYLATNNLSLLTNVIMTLQKTVQRGSGSAVQDVSAAQFSVPLQLSIPVKGGVDADKLYIVYTDQNGALAKLQPTVDGEVAYFSLPSLATPFAICVTQSSKGYLWWLIGVPVLAAAAVAVFFIVKKVKNKV